MYDNTTVTSINNTVAPDFPANADYFTFSVSANVDEQLFMLIGKRKEWNALNHEQNERSDRRLHEILEIVYNMGRTMTEDTHPDQNIKGKFDDYCKARGHKYQKKTTYFVRICGEVFGRTTCNSYSAYGNALNVALAHEVPIGGLIEFFARVGGIDGARRLGKTGNSESKSKGVTLANKATQVVDQVIQKSVARITDVEVCKLIEKGPKNGMAVMLVTLADDGTLTVHAVSQADSIVDRVVLQAKKEAPTSASNSEEVHANVAA